MIASDTRTNAGVDNVSRYRKSFTFELPRQRVLCLQAAGNLSITQGVLAHISAAIHRADHGEEVETILNCPTLFRSAEIVGELMRAQQDKHRIPLMNQGISSDATVMLAGQRAGGSHRLYRPATSSRRRQIRHSSRSASTNTASRSSTG
jgi:putative proteasome-type protease